jgi:alkanesulfonate monooxygenase
MPTRPLSIEVFTACPASSTLDRQDYIQAVLDVARWSERAGCKGILVYTDNSLIDAWLISQLILQHTRRLCPLVAVQPIYAHPYTVAKTITSLAYLYARRVFLNYVAGGFRNDLIALNDTTPHDRRYNRLMEYALIIHQLLSGQSVSVSGEFYSVKNLRLTPPLPSELTPGVFVSAASEAGRTVASALGAIPVHYPKPSHEYDPGSPQCSGDAGIRLGVIARAAEDTAWEVAHARFPEDRQGQLTHALAMKASDSVWHRQLSHNARTTGRSPYWLTPFENYKTFCPYLVGSYGQVANELARYISLGHTIFLLDVPADETDLNHTNIAFEQALKTLAS